MPPIIDTCKEMGKKALFYVDIVEAWHYRGETIDELIRYIIDRSIM